jgi:hypothetical protein
MFRSSLYKSFAFFGIVFVALINQQAVCKAESNPKIPIVFAYGGPWSDDVAQELENLHLAMKSPNVIEIEPNRKTHPNAKEFDPAIINYWHREGKTVVRRVHGFLIQLDPSNKIRKVPASVEQLIEAWSDALEETDTDGISIDEFDPDSIAEADAFVCALRSVRNRYSRKLIFCWIASQKWPRIYYEAIRDNSDFVMTETYIKSSSVGKLPGYEFPEFAGDIENLDNLAPGIIKKILIGCMVGGKRYHDNPEISQIEFVEAQVRTIRQHVTSKGIAGIALIGHTYEKRELVEHLDRLIDRYFQP